MRINCMAPNDKGRFAEVSVGGIFRSLDDGAYYIKTREHLINDTLHNVMSVDGSLISSTIGERAYIRPTEEVCYLGHLGLNWHPDEF